MPFKDFNAGEVFTADNADTLMRQGLIVVANTAERDAIPSPAWGLRVYRLDTKSIDVWVGGNWLPGNWQAIIPASLQNGFTHGSVQPAFRQVGGLVHLSGNMLRSTAPTDFTTAFILPQWASPRGDAYWSTVTDWGMSVQVTSGGSVRIKASVARASGVGYLLDGISWPMSEL